MNYCSIRNNKKKTIEGFNNTSISIGFMIVLCIFLCLGALVLIVYLFTSGNNTGIDIWGKLDPVWLTTFK
jgi:hypothetical protein